MDEVRTNPIPAGEPPMSPCWREMLQDALGAPWGSQSRIEDLLDRLERRAPR